MLYLYASVNWICVNRHSGISIFNAHLNIKNLSASIVRLSSDNKSPEPIKTPDALQNDHFSVKFNTLKATERSRAHKIPFRVPDRFLNRSRCPYAQYLLYIYVFIYYVGRKPVIMRSMDGRRKWMHCERALGWTYEITLCTYRFFPGLYFLFSGLFFSVALFFYIWMSTYWFVLLTFIWLIYFSDSRYNAISPDWLGRCFIGDFFYNEK